jgi:glycosyltransferase involved in cell wall biosynthesis
MVPGNLLTATGGYEYDRRMVERLRALGWTVRVHTLDSSFPTPTAQALSDAQQQLAALSPQSLVLIDGLALGAMPDAVQPHADRLRLIGLVHHPLAVETGLSQELAARLAASERRALQAMRMVIVTSHATRRALAHYGVAAHRIAVVEPGVDRPQDENFESHSRDGGSPLRMLCVATLTPRKGHDLLVEALAGLREHAWVLNCVGDIERSPATVSALRARIDAAGVEERITLTGELDAAALAEQLRTADLFVLATRFEGYGMAVAQALSFGLPVVSTRTGAIAELVSSQAGLLVEPNDSAALREALARLLLEPALLRRLASGARDAGANLSDWNTASQCLSGVLADAAQRPLDMMLRS